MGHWLISRTDCFRTARPTCSCFFLDYSQYRKKKKMEREKNKHKKKLDMMDTREPTVIHIVVLFENATYIEPPKSAKSVTAQGYDLLRVK